VIYSAGPDQVDYTAHGILDALIVDNTGIWRDKAGLEAHLKCKGASKVLLTTPGSGVPNIVAGPFYMYFKYTLMKTKSYLTRRIIHE